MLTLTRKVGEVIRIGDDVQIVVKEIRKNQVRIGIIAPRNVKIFREEVYQNIVAENRRAAHADVAMIDDLMAELADAGGKAGKDRRSVSDDSGQNHGPGRDPGGQAGQGGV